MPWNKRTMEVTAERRLDVKEFRQIRGSAATSQRATKLEKVVAEFEIELDIDFNAIFQVMGRKAALAKSKRCTDGFVTVKARRKRELSRTVEPIPVPDYYEEVT